MKSCESRLTTCSIDIVDLITSGEISSQVSFDEAPGNFSEESKESTAQQNIVICFEGRQLANIDVRNALHLTFKNLTFLLLKNNKKKREGDREEQREEKEKKESFKLFCSFELQMSASKISSDIWEASTHRDQMRDYRSVPQSVMDIR